MKAFLKMENATTSVALALSIVCICIATICAVYQVGTRFFFGQPSIWSEVVTRSMMIWCVFLGVSVAFRTGSMIAVEMVQRALPKRFGLALYQVACGLCILFFSILAWQGFAMTLRVVPQSLAGLDVSIAWVYAAIPTGSVFTLVAIGGCMIRAAQGQWEADLSLKEAGL